MRKTGTPLRQAINRHLYRHHDGFVGHGTTENRMIQHEMLHAKGSGHTHPDPDDPTIFDTEEG